MCVSNNQTSVGLTKSRLLKYPSVTHSIYAGRHVVPGLEGLLIKCATDVECAWSPLNGPGDNQVPFQYD